MDERQKGRSVPKSPTPATASAARANRSTKTNNSATADANSNDRRITRLQDKPPSSPGVTKRSKSQPRDTRDVPSQGRQTPSRTSIRAVSPNVTSQKTSASVKVATQTKEESVRKASLTVSSAPKTKAATRALTTVPSEGSVPAGGDEIGNVSATAAAETGGEFSPTLVAKSITGSSSAQRNASPKTLTKVSETRTPHNSQSSERLVTKQTNKVSATRGAVLLQKSPEVKRRERSRTPVRLRQTSSPIQAPRRTLTSSVQKQRETDSLGANQSTKRSPLLENRESLSASKFKSASHKGSPNSKTEVLSASKTSSPKSAPRSKNIDYGRSISDTQSRGSPRPFSGSKKDRTAAKLDLNLGIASYTPISGQPNNKQKEKPGQDSKRATVEGTIPDSANPKKPQDDGIGSKVRRNVNSRAGTDDQMSKDSRSDSHWNSSPGCSTPVGKSGKDNRTQTVEQKRPKARSDGNAQRKSEIKNVRTLRRENAFIASAKKHDERPPKRGEERHKVPLERHSVGIERPSVGTERYSVGRERHSVDTERHSVDTERHSVDTERHSVDTERHSVATTREDVHKSIDKRLTQSDQSPEEPGQLSRTVDTLPNNRTEISSDSHRQRPKGPRQRDGVSSLADTAAHPGHGEVYNERDEMAAQRGKEIKQSDQRQTVLKEAVQLPKQDDELLKDGKEVLTPQHDDVLTKRNDMPLESETTLKEHDESVKYGKIAVDLKDNERAASNNERPSTTTDDNQTKNATGENSLHKLRTQTELCGHSPELTLTEPRTHSPELTLTEPRTHSPELTLTEPRTHSPELTLTEPRTHSPELTLTEPRTHSPELTLTEPRTHSPELTLTELRTHSPELTLTEPRTHSPELTLTEPRTHSPEPTLTEGRRKSQEPTLRDGKTKSQKLTLTEGKTKSQELTLTEGKTKSQELTLTIDQHTSSAPKHQNPHLSPLHGDSYPDLTFFTSPVDEISSASLKHLREIWTPGSSSAVSSRCSSVALDIKDGGSSDKEDGSGSQDERGRRKEEGSRIAEEEEEDGSLSPSPVFFRDRRPSAVYFTPEKGYDFPWLTWSFSVHPDQEELHPSPHQTLEAARDPNYILHLALDVGDVIGQGQYGTVYETRLRSTKKQADGKAGSRVMALKKLHKTDEETTVHALAEQRALLVGRVCPFIVTMLSCFQTKLAYYLLLELAEGGSLSNVLKHAGRLPEVNLRFYAAQLLIALAFLHDRDILHRDLKLDNVLLDAKGYIRLCDFGLSMDEFGDDDQVCSPCGTLYYVAPEVLRGEPYSKTADWWSYGVLLYQLASGTLPFIGQNIQALYIAVTRKEPVYPSFLSSDVTSYLQKMLCKHPSNRPGNGKEDRQTLTDDPFFRAIDWSALYNGRVDPPPLPEHRLPPCARSDNLSVEPDIILSVSYPLDFLDMTSAQRDRYSKQSRSRSLDPAGLCVPGANR